MGLVEDVIDQRIFTCASDRTLWLYCSFTRASWSLGSSCGFFYEDAHGRKCLFGMRCLGCLGFIRMLNFLNQILENSLNFNQRTLLIFLIEVNDSGFYSSVERHPEEEQIYGTLRAPTKSMRSSAYIPDFMGVDERN
ncbi:hypothetical protein SADUNF_Sadunf10G0091100 [Salix dunnii]|uniref:Uncharacterized protein n=1 Tax=Salix dunnii TaxID=1413687 RepID=A0A835JMY5_9ROSI|nr:hypothetical protein SADUNF_Sadunf10G0091100 [Salix dunnii]